MYFGGDTSGINKSIVVFLLNRWVPVPGRHSNVLNYLCATGVKGRGVELDSDFKIFSMISEC